MVNIHDDIFGGRFGFFCRRSSGGCYRGLYWIVHKTRFPLGSFEDPRELGRQVGGAALMGIGGVIATGCSVGQGLSAFATLSYSAPITLAAITAGGLLGLRQLIHGFQPE